MQLSDYASITPANSGAVETAVGWVAAVLTGNVGTIIAVLAVAGVGAGMLLGRLSVRSGARVVIGCFVLFGAPVIAMGLAELAAVSDSSAMPVDGSAGAYLPPPKLADPPGVKRDPYAGA